VITIEISTAIMIEIATAMIVTQTGTAMGAMIGIEVGIGEIVIAAIGTVIDSRSNDNFRESSISTALALGLIERQPHHLRRILSAHRIEFVLV
jgi:hypothetical protein